MSKSEQRLDNLLEKARHASEGPGVYRMLDQHSKIIYIGKAKNLKNRVRTYFQKNIEDAKTRALVAKIHDFELILTQSEAEALVLESLLIKKHKPRYNIQLRDDKSYPYVLIDHNHTFPRLTYARRPKKKKGLQILGPFASATALRTAIRLINRSFRLRDCSDSEFTNRSRPCINHQIGICSAPCTAMITPQEYQADVESAVRVLHGYGKEVVATLTNEMEKLSEAMEFEHAARLRDQIQFLRDTIERKHAGQAVERGHTETQNRDVVGWYRKPDSATIAVLFFRRGDLVDSSTFHFDDIEGRSDEEILFQFLAQFYLAENKLEDSENIPTGAFAFPGAEAKSWPDQILLPFAFSEMELLQESFLSLQHQVEFLLPQKGIKHEQILLAEKNAENAFDEKQREKGSIYRVLSDLKAKLRLENYPRRIECFDISNLGDTGIVASRVTFIEGKPDKSLYRHYKIRSTQTQNDFASMREVIERRLIKTLKEGEHHEEPPDLLMIDGGKGQLAMAVEVMKELNITGVDLVSLAKARPEAGGGVEFPQEKNPAMNTPTAESSANMGEGHSESTREVEKNFERIFKPGRMNPIVLAPDSPVCHLLQRVRDEAHRFAIEFQRKQRKNY